VYDAGSSVLSGECAFELRLPVLKTAITCIGRSIRVNDDLINNTKPLWKGNLLVGRGAVLVEEALGRIAKDMAAYAKPPIRAKQLVWGGVTPCAILTRR